MKNISKVMGRPKHELDVDLFEELCRMQCTQEEICGAMRISDTTLWRRIRECYDKTFEEIYQELSKAGHSSLRRSMWRNALRNNSFPAQKFLAQNHLGMSEKIDTTNINTNINKDYEFIRPEDPDQTTKTDTGPEKVKSE